jgi:hypothetical protein
MDGGSSDGHCSGKFWYEYAQRNHDRNYVASRHEVSGDIGTSDNDDVGQSPVLGPSDDDNEGPPVLKSESDNDRLPVHWYNNDASSDEDGNDACMGYLQRLAGCPGNNHGNAWRTHDDCGQPRAMHGARFPGSEPRHDDKPLPTSYTAGSDGNVDGFHGRGSTTTGVNGLHDDEFSSYGSYSGDDDYFDDDEGQFESNFDTTSNHVPYLHKTDESELC